MLDKRRFLGRGARLAVAAAGWRFAAPAFAAVYLEPAQARAALWPAAARFEPVALDLDAAALARIGERAGTRVHARFAPKVERAADATGVPLGWVVFDAVVGKFELIDYAVGLDAQGTVTGVEVLVYRESHGAEIRNAAWRRQFVGRRGPERMRFEDEIRNLSGATLSCRHLTEGVQRIGALHAVVLAGAAR